MFTIEIEDGSCSKILVLDIYYILALESLFLFNNETNLGVFKQYPLFPLN